MAPPFLGGGVDGRAHARTSGGTPVPGAAVHRSASTAAGGVLSYPVIVFPRRPAVLVLALAVLVGACAGGAEASFDPTGPCLTDGSAAGAYPDLEALVPTTYEGRAPDTLDSGRHCSSEEL